MATKDQRAQLLTMFNSGDIDTVRHGVEEFVALDDPELWSEVLDGARFEPAVDRIFRTGNHKSVFSAAGRLVGTGFFKWNTRSSRWDELILRLLVGRSDSPLRDQVLSLDAGAQIAAKDWLPIVFDGLDAFPNLTQLDVYTGIDELDLAPLGALTNLRKLRLVGWYAGMRSQPIEVPAMANVEFLQLSGRSTFSLGEMPALREAVLDAPVSGPLGLKTVRALSMLNRFNEPVVAHCPDIDEFTCTDLWERELAIPKGARLVGGVLHVHNPSDLGDVATLTNLQWLTLENRVESIVGLESLADCVDLRVLDIRGHRSVTDISFLEGHPNLRMVAAGSTSITKESVPASMKKIVSFAAKPDLKKALERPAPGTPVPKPEASKLTSAQRKAMTKLKKLFHQVDLGSIMQAVELVVSLDDPDIWHELLDGVGYEKGGVLVDKNGRPRDVVGRLVPNKFFTGTMFRQPWLDVALAQLIARSQSTLRSQVTHLALGQWSYSTSPLGTLNVGGLAGFDKLRSLQLMRASSYDLSELDEISGLQELNLQVGCELPSHAVLQQVTSRGLLSFEAGGRWPALTKLDAKQVEDIAPLAQGAPNVTVIAAVLTTPSPVVAGFAQLTNLVVSGRSNAIAIERCPALEELTTNGLESLQVLPALRRLSVHRIRSFDFLEKLPGLEQLTIGNQVAVDKVRIATSAKLEGRLRLSGVRDLGNVSELANLQILQLSDIDDALSLGPLAAATELRVLDVRGCAGVADLSPLEGLPELRMIAVRESGVLTVPSSLNHVVSRAAELDLEGAAAKALPRVPSSKKKIPVPESERAAWEAVLAGLATSDVETALAAVDRAGELDHGGLEFLLSKVSVLRHQLRPRAPFRLSSRVLLPPVVARILSHLSPDSAAAAPFRLMTTLVVEGERRGTWDLQLDGLEAFTALDQLLVHKCRVVSCSSIRDSKISLLAIKRARVHLDGLPPTLRSVLLEEVYSPDLAPFALETIHHLSLKSIIGDLELGPLIGSPPKEICLGVRMRFQSELDVPGELAERCVASVGDFKQWLWRVS